MEQANMRWWGCVEGTIMSDLRSHASLGVGLRVDHLDCKRVGSAMSGVIVLVYLFPFDRSDSRDSAYCATCSLL